MNKSLKKLKLNLTTINTLEQSEVRGAGTLKACTSISIFESCQSVQACSVRSCLTDSIVPDGPGIGHATNVGC